MKKQTKPFTFRGTFFFLAVLALYAATLFFSPQSFQMALLKSGHTLLKILPIFCLVIFFTSLLNFFLQPKHIGRHLGHESGIKGWLWALAAGVLSHGPMYAWYPLLEDLREHGMKDGLITVFFASRTIKIPLLPMMIDYFGLPFTLIISTYILFGALIQGMVLDFLSRRCMPSPDNFS